MAYRDMPRVDPSALDPELRAIARRFWREERRRRARWIAAGVLGVLASTGLALSARPPVGMVYLTVMNVSVPLAFALLLTALYCVRGLAHVPASRWELAVEGDAVRVSAYGRTARLRLAHVLAATYFYPRDRRGRERPSGGQLELALHDGTRLIVPSGTVGREELGAALALRLAVRRRAIVG